MKHVKYYLLLVSALLTFSCDDKSEQTIKDNQDSEVNYHILIGETAGQVLQSDPIQLESATQLQNGIVELDVQYSGGCEEHSFDIYWNSSIALSNPPQITLIITHNANHDLCEAAIRDKLSIDLKEFFDLDLAYRALIRIKTFDNSQSIIVD